MLVLDGQKGDVAHRMFPDICSLIQPGDLMVFNNTRVIPARLFGQKETGGKVEMLVERLLDDHRVLAHLRSSKSPKQGAKLIFEGGAQAEVEVERTTCSGCVLPVSSPCWSCLKPMDTCRCHPI